MSDAQTLTKRIISQAIERLDNIWSCPLIDEMPFRAAYGDLDDAGKLTVTKTLALAGLLHPTTARKRKPMPPYEILRELHTTIVHAHARWAVHRKHLEDFRQSEWFKAAQDAAEA